MCGECGECGVLMMWCVDELMAKQPDTRKKMRVVF